MTRIRTIVLSAVVVVGVAAPAGATATPLPAHPAHCALPHFGPGRDYHPRIVASRFGPTVDNPWFPLPPGTTYVYAGSEGRHSLVDVYAPSRHTRVIDGVRTRIVNDRLYTDGVLSERTSDYYAQDLCGNVWYFGEDTAEIDPDGTVTSTDGTWHAGVDGGQPGVYMQAHPQLGRDFRQEWERAVAEDQYAALSLHTVITVPYGSYHNALRTKETSGLEPGVLDNKVYVYGLGEVLEQTVGGGTEKLSLVDVLQ